MLLNDNDRIVQIEMLENALVDKKDAGAIRKELLNRSLSTNGTGAVKVVAIIQNPQTFYDMFEQIQGVVDDYQKAQAGQREKYYTLENGRAKKHFRTVSKSYPYQFSGLVYQGDINDMDKVEGSDYVKELIKDNPYNLASGLNTNLLSRTRLKNEFLKKYADYNNPEYKGKRAELTAEDKKYFALVEQYNQNRERTNAELEKIGVKDTQSNYSNEDSNGVEYENQLSYSMANDSEEQYKEVYNRYHDTDEWLKAPNGKPTNLTEEQWVKVRTPNFKKWFGDWEQLERLKKNIPLLLDMNIVGEITGQEFKKDNEKITDKVSRFYNEKYNGVVNRKDLGDILIDERSVKDSLAHGLGRLKSSAFAIAPEVIKNGIIVDYSNNWKSRGYDTYIISAPVKIDNQQYICETIITKNNERTGFYLHEVNLQEKISEEFKTATNGKKSITHGSSPNSIILKNYNKVQSNTSKVVDENGEPLVVYHGSSRWFTKFDVNSNKSSNLNAPNVIFTTGNKDIANSFVNVFGDEIDYVNLNEETSKHYRSDNSFYRNGGVYSLFLNIKNPKIIDYNNNSWRNGLHDDIKTALSEKYDGLIAKNIKDVGFTDTEKVPSMNEYISFNSNQIKSVTDNTGDFSTENDDIRYSLEGKNTKLPYIQSFAESESAKELTDKEKERLLNTIKKKGYVLSYENAEYYNDTQTIDTYNELNKIALSGLDLVEFAREKVVEQAENENETVLQTKEEIAKDKDRSESDVFNLKQTLVDKLLEHFDTDKLTNNEMNAVDMAIKIAGLTSAAEQTRIFKEKLKNARELVKFLNNVDKWATRIARHYDLDFEKILVNRASVTELSEAKEYIDENIETFALIDKAFLDNPSNPDIEKAVYYGTEANAILNDVGFENSESDIQEAEDSEDSEDDVFTSGIRTNKEGRVVLVGKNHLNMENIDYLADEKERVEKAEAKLKKRLERAEKLSEKEKEKLQRRLERVADQKKNIIERYEKAKNARIIKGLLKHSKTHDAFEEPMLLWIRTKYFTTDSEKYKARVERLARLGGYDIDSVPEMLQDIFARNAFFAESVEGELTLDDLKALKASVRELRRTARISLEQKQIERRNMLWSAKQDAFNTLRVNGEPINIDPNNEEERRLLNEEIEGYTARLDLNQKEKSEFKRFLEGVIDEGSKVEHIWVISQKIDGGKGVFSQMVKAQRALTSLEEREITRRLERFNAQLKNLGLNENTLPSWLIYGKKEKAYSVELLEDRGEGKVEYLNRNEAIGLYIYSLNKDGEIKLNNLLGNRYKKESIDALVASLSDTEKKFAKLLMESVGEKLGQIRDLTYTEYNENILPVENYFPLVGKKSSIGGVSTPAEYMGDKADSLNLDPRTDTRYADRSMTKERTGAIYPIDLNVWATYQRAIRNQEHFLHFARWVRNAQYILSNKGVGHVIPSQFGRTTYNVFKAYVNDVAQPNNVYISNGTLDKIFGNVAVSKLFFNPVSAIKQIGAFGGVFMDENTTLKSIMGAFRDLNIANLAKRRATIEFIRDKSGLISSQQSKLGIAFERMRTDSLATEKDIKIRKWQELGLKFMETMDMEARYVVWWNSFNASLAKGLSENEAVYKADEIVSKTQNSSFVGDLSYIEKNAHGIIARAALVFSNQKFKYLNAMLGAKGQGAKAIGSVVAMLGVSAVINLLLSGLLFKRPSEDEDDEKKRLTQALLRLLNEMTLGQVPFVGDTIEAKIMGYRAGGGDILTGAFLDPILNVAERIKKVAEGKATSADVALGVFDVGVGVLEMLFSVPSVEIQRLKRLYNKEWGGFDFVGGVVNAILGSGIYKSLR